MAHQSRPAIISQLVGVVAEEARNLGLQPPGGRHLDVMERLARLAAAASIGTGLPRKRSSLAERACNLLVQRLEQIL